LLAAERRQIIKGRIQAAGRVVVSELSPEFGVSEETIRRDLEWMEQQGIASRTYGGAVLADAGRVAPPYSIRKGTNIDEKVAIAQRFSAMVKDGDTLMVDESSTAAYAVRALRHLRDITLITNSIELLQEMSSQESWRIISTGGALKSEVMALVGPHALNTVASYHVGYTVFSCRGVNTRLGLADSDEQVVEVKRAMLKACDCAILLADHRKLDRSGFTALGPLSLADRLVTDREPPEEWLLRLEEQGVEAIWG